jgi:hypothetical protein
MAATDTVICEIGDEAEETFEHRAWLSCLMDAGFCEARAKADEMFEYEAYDTMDQYQMAALGRD